MKFRAIGFVARHLLRPRCWHCGGPLLRWARIEMAHDGEEYYTCPDEHACNKRIVARAKTREEKERALLERAIREERQAQE